MNDAASDVIIQLFVIPVAFIAASEKYRSGGCSSGCPVSAARIDLLELSDQEQHQTRPAYVTILLSRGPKIT